MEEIEGILTITPIDSRNIESGSIVLMEKDDTYKKVVISHLTRDGLWVTTDNEVIEKEYFYKILLLTDDDKSYPLVFNDYDKAISQGIVNQGSLTSKKFKFKIKPFKFKKGKSSQTCSECMSSFTAAPSQPLCISCCNDYSTASIVSKNKKAKMIHEDDVVTIALKAYKKGIDKVIRVEVEEWLYKELKKL